MAGRRGMPEIFTQLRWQDALDIGIIAFIIYRLIAMMRGTRAMQMIMGLVIVLMFYVGSQWLGLFTLNWILDNFLGSLILLVLVGFLNDIRRRAHQGGTGELVESVFSPRSPIHDGALVIRKGRIAAAKCILPLSENARVGRDVGTRHRAAVGLTEGTDAVVVVVSEESGKISLVSSGKVNRDLDGPELRSRLEQLLSA